MTSSESPPDDVTFRPSDAPAPTFSGMTPTLPPALRELRRQKNTPRPSEMTALARRFGGIRLDFSPNSEPPTPKAPQKQILPVKLEFSECDGANSKENVIAGVLSPQQNRPIQLSLSNSTIISPVPNAVEQDTKLSRYDYDNSQPCDLFLIQSESRRRCSGDPPPAEMPTIKRDSNEDGSNSTAQPQDENSIEGLNESSSFSANRPMKSDCMESGCKVSEAGPDVEANEGLAIDLPVISVNRPAVKTSEHADPAIQENTVEINDKNADVKSSSAEQAHTNKRDFQSTNMPGTISIEQSLRLGLEFAADCSEKTRRASVLQVTTASRELSEENDVERLEESELTGEMPFSAKSANDTTSPKCSERVLSDSSEKDKPVDGLPHPEQQVFENTPKIGDIAKMVDTLVAESTNCALSRLEKSEQAVLPSFSCATSDTTERNSLETAPCSDQCADIGSPDTGIDGHQPESALLSEKALSEIEPKPMQSDCSVEQSIEQSPEEINIADNVAEDVILGSHNPVFVCNTDVLTATEVRDVVSVTIPGVPNLTEGNRQEHLATGKESVDSATSNCDAQQIHNETSELVPATSGNYDELLGPRSHVNYGKLDDHPEDHVGIASSNSSSQERSDFDHISRAEGPLSTGESSLLQVTDEDISKSPAKLNEIENTEDLQKPNADLPKDSIYSCQKTNDEVTDDIEATGSPSHITQENKFPLSSKSDFSILKNSEAPSEPIAQDTLACALPRSEPHGQENRLLIQLKSDLKKIEEGKTKWKWPDRCEALKFVTNTVRDELSPDAFQILSESLSTLALNLKLHLEELRPSVITSSLYLFDSVLMSRLPSEKFTELLFPSLVEIASGYSITALVAAHSLVNAISAHPCTENMLDNVDNLNRLMEVLKEYADKSEEGEEDSRRVQRALEIVMQKSAAASFIPSPDNAAITAFVNSQAPNSIKSLGFESLSSSSAAQKGLPGDEPESNKFEPSSILSSEEAQPERKVVNEDVSLTTPRLDMPSSVDRFRSLRMSRMSWRSRLDTPLLLGKTNILKEGFDLDNADASQGKQLGTGLRDRSSGRMYTSSEVEEIRQAAIEAVIDKMGHTHKEERDKLNQERMDMERMLAKEKAENNELRAVLEEYEITLNKMVAEGNTQANEKHLALQEEKNKLKAEVVEIRDAFEQLKRKYDKTKQTVEVMAAKENRIIEQNVELKRNMVELQKWSNELKTNTEKKLNKAFENVTSFRTSYIEQEAHAKKALSDLEKIQCQLDSETSNHTDTAAKLAHCEAELHREQDASAELKAEFATMKESFTRISSERDTALEKLEEAYKELGSLKMQVEKLESRANRASDLQKQMETMRAERQELKARAFDDMTRIRQLEEDVEGKEKELDELGVLCEEAMNQLEAFKLGHGDRS